MKTFAPLLSLLLMFGLASCVTPPATPTFPFQVEVLQSGLFEKPAHESLLPASGTAAGVVGEHGSIRFLKTTSNLKAEPGATFGFRYQLKDVPGGSISGLEMRVIHPPMTGPSGKTETVSIAEVAGHNGQAEIIYIIDEPFEMLPGNWTLQLLYQGQVVVSRDFYLR